MHNSGPHCCLASQLSAADLGGSVLFWESPEVLPRSPNRGLEETASAKQFCELRGSTNAVAGVVHRHLLQRKYPRRLLKPRLINSLTIAVKPLDGIRGEFSRKTACSVGLESSKENTSKMRLERLPWIPWALRWRLLKSTHGLPAVNITGDDERS